MKPAPSAQSAPSIQPTPSAQPTPSIQAAPSIRPAPVGRSAPSVRPGPHPPVPDQQDLDEDLARYLAAHPSPAAAVDALIRDERGRLLLVDPVYKDGWDLPGGMVDDEGLVDGLLRELHEELRPAAVRVGRLLAVDNVPAAVYGRAMTACVYAVHLPLPVRAADLTLQQDELRAAEFVPEDEALARLPERLRRRAAAALAAERGSHTAHLHDGRPAPQSPHDRRATLPAPAVTAIPLVVDETGRVLVVPDRAAPRDAAARLVDEAADADEPADAPVTGSRPDPDAGTDAGRDPAPDADMDAERESVCRPGAALGGSGWRLPQGAVRAGERTRSAAGRALEQVAGVEDVVVERLLAVVEWAAPPRGRALLTHVYETRATAHERAAVRRVPLASLAALLPPHEAHVLHRALAARAAGTVVHLEPPVGPGPSAPPAP
ncbi:NUDIX domain-containing protein [Streptomyces axinellae]|uniref:Nudix hydrolase domain-containing protein n=1 Tax=Streptomyces axinellae TaxID=552788 RepID=A0ABP6CBQ5_9ACTN